MQDKLNQESKIAGAQCLLQICESAPSGYLFSNDLVQALVGAIFSFLPEKSESQKESKTQEDESQSISLQAASKLGSKAQGPFKTPILVKLALKAMTIVESTAEGIALENF